ncbi:MULTISPECIES: TrmB family transcriptional regulator [Halorubrum]|uniref:TrmB family transcriptional regulator n=1 Tax=Halorubrum TaxID=56688 RepID=UPI001305397E|nr:MULTISPECIES: helix-turn-helix domain-containing protein [Halorubrum]
MNALPELGLSSYEEQTYRTLLQTGKATARTVAARSEVPLGRIYDVFNGLQNRGLVETRPGEPKHYVAVDPTQAVDLLLEERLDELDTKADRYRKLAAQARSTFTPSPPIDANLWLADFGVDDSTTLISEQSSVVTEQIRAAIGPPYTQAPLSEYIEEYELLLENVPHSVTVELLLERALLESLGGQLELAKRTDADVTVRRTDRLKMTFAVLDGTETYIDIPYPSAEDRRFGFIEVRNPTVAAELDDVFDELWTDATPVE